MSEKYLDTLSKGDLAEELANRHSQVQYEDAVEVLDHFEGDYREAVRFLEKCYNPEKGDVVLQLAIHAHKIEECGLCGCLEGEDIMLALADEFELERIADRESRQEEVRMLTRQLGHLRET